jgi:excisionase family DNA binding protein
MLTESVYTLEEVSQYLRVPVEALRQEISAGRLQALKITDLTRIEESALKAYKEAAKAGPLPPAVEPSESADNFLKQIQPALDFTHKWPDGSNEDFKEARECVALYRGREHHVKFGFAIRKAAGKDRLRVLVLVDRYPTVEFVGDGAEMESGKEQVASVIKDRKGKQLPIGAALPPEYQGLHIGPYRDVVVGPNASNGLAVICKSDDLHAMGKHALIRYTYRQERA